MSIESPTIPLVITPADIEAIVRHAQNARAEAIRMGLLRLPSRIRAWATQRPHLGRLPRFGLRA